jgi:iron-sulfur cluster insertion protein
MESTNTSLVSDRQPPAAAFRVTESAFARIGVISSDEPKGTYFRVEVLGGGCSGYQYNYKLDQTPVAAGDTIIEHAGTKVVVDDVSMGLLAGSVLDYVEDLGSAGFEIKNPNAKSGCGCGNSFSL